jgi:predicted nucleic acid-binding protein
VAVALPIFVDTSVLLAGLIEMAGPNTPAQRTLAAVAKGRFAQPRTAWHCCLEFYSVSTRLPEEFRLRPEDAARLVEEEILARFDVDVLPARSRLPLFRDALADGVAGGRIYDSHIAEVARAGGAKTVVTENRRHFLSLLRSGIVVLTADELAADLSLHKAQR